MRIMVVFFQEKFLGVQNLFFEKRFCILFLAMVQ